MKNGYIATVTLFQSWSSMWCVACVYFSIFTDIGRLVLHTNVTSFSYRWWQLFAYSLQKSILFYYYLFWSVPSPPVIFSPFVLVEMLVILAAYQGGGCGVSLLHVRGCCFRSVHSLGVLYLLHYNVNMRWCYLMFSIDIERTDICLPVNASIDLHLPKSLYMPFRCWLV